MTALYQLLINLDRFGTSFDESLPIFVADECVFDMFTSCSCVIVIITT